MPLRLRAFPVAAAVLLAACSSPTPPSDAATTPPSAGTAATPNATTAATCDAAKAEWAIGQTLDEALLERTRVDAGARSVRSLKPGQMVTMEFNAERLNVDVDAAGIVTGVRCG